MNILLVEPNYKNKYPPMGLMKISTYHKNRGDNVTFYKGLLKSEDFSQGQFDRIYITSLFTFHYKITLKTILYYCRLSRPENIFIGGIMVSLLSDQLRLDLGNQVNFLVGLLTDSVMLGFNDAVNIDSLPLDYGILDEIEYDYPAGDNYISYTTRGCPNRCLFCAVPLLEPQYSITNNIKKQISNINVQYGEKRNLLLLDNNIFNLPEDDMRILAEDLKASGFTREPTFRSPNPLELFFSKCQNPKMHSKVTDRATEYLFKISKQIRKIENMEIYIDFLYDLSICSDPKAFIIQNRDYLMSVIENLSKRKLLKRYIDFNQGLEAARMTESKIKILAQLPLRPVRIAFDHYNKAAVDNYTKAVELSSKYGITSFSNYMLYNFDDKPEDLWYRIKINIELAKRLNVSMFSFPMKYMPIDRTDRNYIGQHWNKKYLQGITAILLATKGVVASGESFFKRAFGKNIEEYFKILSMPREFIIYRNYYEEKGYTQEWYEKFKLLSSNEKNVLFCMIYDESIEPESENIRDIIIYYQKEFSYEYLRKHGL